VIFGYVERTGATSGNLLKPNDLEPLCDAYQAWRAAILRGCGRWLALAAAISH
jgi:hypothetical protein